MAKQTTNPVKFKYSHAIKKGQSRKYKGLGRTQELRDADEMEKTKTEYRIGLSTIVNDGILDKGIAVYKHWFNFVVLALELEQQGAVLIYKKKEHEIKVDRSMYEGWDLDTIVSKKFNDWFFKENHRDLFIRDISRVLKPKEKVSVSEDKVSIEFDANRRLADVIADLRRINNEQNIFRGNSDGFKSNYIVNGRVIEATLKNRYNALVLKLENNLSNEEILTHKNNYIRATSKSIDGYKSQQEQTGTDESKSEDEFGKVIKDDGIDTRSELEKSMYGELPTDYSEIEVNEKEVDIAKPTWAYTIHELIHGSPSTTGAKQILLSVCDGYFLKHPTKDYSE